MKEDREGRYKKHYRANRNQNLGYQCIPPSYLPRTLQYTQAERRQGPGIGRIDNWLDESLLKLPIQSVFLQRGDSPSSSPKCLDSSPEAQRSSLCQDLLSLKPISNPTVYNRLCYGTAGCLGNQTSHHSTTRNTAEKKRIPRCLPFERKGLQAVTAYNAGCSGSRILL